MVDGIGVNTPSLDLGRQNFINEPKTDPNVQGVEARTEQVDDVGRAIKDYEQLQDQPRIEQGNFFDPATYVAESAVYRGPTA